MNLTNSSNTQDGFLYNFWDRKCPISEIGGSIENEDTFTSSYGWKSDIIRSGTPNIFNNLI